MTGDEHWLRMPGKITHGLETEFWRQVKELKSLDDPEINSWIDDDVEMIEMCEDVQSRVDKDDMTAFFE